MTLPIYMKITDLTATNNAHIFIISDLFNRYYNALPAYNTHILS